MENQFNLQYLQDNFQYIQDFLTNNLPPSLLSTLTSQTRTYWTIYKYLLTFKSLFLTLLSPLLTRLQSSPDIASVGLLLVFLWISLQALRYMRRAFMFWVRMSMRATYWAVIVGVAGWAWGRGWEGMMQDLQTWGGVFWGEYERWKEVQEGGKGAGRSTGKTKGR